MERTLPARNLQECNVHVRSAKAGLESARYGMRMRRDTDSDGDAAVNFVLLNRGISIA